MGRISFIDRTWNSIEDSIRAGNAPPADSTGHFLAHLWRESPTLGDAVRRWMAENPGLPEGGLDSLSEEDLAQVSSEARLRARSHSRTRTVQEVCDEVAGRLDALAESGVEGSTALVRALEAAIAGERTFADVAAGLPEGSPFRPVVDMMIERVTSIATGIGLRQLAEKTLFAATRPQRQRLGKTLLAALGNSSEPNYEAAGQVVDECLDGIRALPEVPPSVQAFGTEVSITVGPLVVAFGSPKAFFCDLLPKLQPPEVDGRDVTAALRRWGPGILLNPTVRAAFDSRAGEPGFADVLAAAKNGGGFGGSGGRDPDPEKRDYRALAAEYYALRRGTKKRWLEVEAQKRPVIDPDSLLVLIRRSRPRKDA